MQVANLSVDFLFPLLHGVWARSAAGVALDRFATAGSEEAVGRLLAALGIDATQSAGVQRQLLRRHITELSALQRFVDPGTARFYAAFLDRHFVENLKTVLHFRLFPEYDGDLHSLLVDAPALPPLDAEALCRARDTAHFLDLLPEHPCRAALLPVLAEVERTRDILVAECRLDQVFYAELLGASARLPGYARRVGRELVGTEIDTDILLMLMRNLATYALPPDAMLRLCPTGGCRVTEAVRQRLCRCTAAEAFHSALPAPYRALLEPLREAALPLSEDALWNAFWRRCQAHFADFDRPTASLAAFPYLKRFETLNLGRAFEATRFGLGPADIREMMIGPGHA